MSNVFFIHLSWISIKTAACFQYYHVTLTIYFKWPCTDGKSTTVPSSRCMKRLRVHLYRDEEDSFMQTLKQEPGVCSRGRFNGPQSVCVCVCTDARFSWLQKHISVILKRTNMPWIPDRQRDFLSVWESVIRALGVCRAISPGLTSMETTLSEKQQLRALAHTHIAGPCTS